VERIPVDSTMMASVGYAARRRTLEIEFRTGEVYHYYGVSPDVFRALLEAPSKGRFFHGEIDGAFEYARVDRTSTAPGRAGDAGGRGVTSAGARSASGRRSRRAPHS
jgi:hypothetical protein